MKRWPYITLLTLISLFSLATLVLSAYYRSQWSSDSRSDWLHRLNFHVFVSTFATATIPLPWLVSVWLALAWAALSGILWFIGAMLILPFDGRCNLGDYSNGDTDVCVGNLYVWIIIVTFSFVQVWHILWLVGKILVDVHRKNQLTYASKLPIFKSWTRPLRRAYQSGSTTELTFADSSAA